MITGAARLRADLLVDLNPYALIQSKILLSLNHLIDLCFDFVPIVINLSYERAN